MIRKNRQLVTNEPVEFENWLVEIQDCKKITDHFRGICRIFPNSIKENLRMLTCNRLDFANTRISNGYAQKSPWSLVQRCPDLVEGCSTLVWLGWTKNHTRTLVDEGLTDDSHTFMLLYGKMPPAPPPKMSIFMAWDIYIGPTRVGIQSPYSIIYKQCMHQSTIRL